MLLCFHRLYPVFFESLSSVPFDDVLSGSHCLGPSFLIDRILDLSIACTNLWMFEHFSLQSSRQTRRQIGLPELAQSLAVIDDRVVWTFSHESGKPVA